MSVIDGFAIKAINNKLSIKITSVEMDAPKEGTDLYIGFQYNGIPLYIYPTIWEDKKKQIQRVIYLIQRAIVKYEERAKSNVDKTQRQIIVHTIMATKNIRYVRSPVKDSIKKSGYNQTKYDVEQYVDKFAKKNTQLKYEELYEHCMKKYTRVWGKN